MLSPIQPQAEAVPHPATTSVSVEAVVTPSAIEVQSCVVADPIPTQEEPVNAGAALFAVCTVCICCGGGIAALVFSIIFLIDDEGKGGSDSECIGAGHAIWVWVVVRLASHCLTNCIDQVFFLSEEECMKIGAFTAHVTFNWSMIIYGGVVIFNSEVCDGYKRTGLYTLSLVYFYGDVVVTTIYTVAGGNAAARGLMEGSIEGESVVDAGADRV
jgi:hypothetical protein